MNIIETIGSMDVSNVGVVEVSDISFLAEFRKACESNACGKYGKCWMCPPFVGEINELIEKAKQYNKAYVYQTIGEIEDSFDIEGMLEAGEKHNEISQIINEKLSANLDKSSYLHLSAGGCKVCKRCAKQDEKPCYFPEKAMASLESYGINVSVLAELAGMKYINGQNTVTYFGAILTK